MVDNNIIFLLQEDSQESVDAGNATFISVDEEISIKEEPMSPASSESSKISECDIKMVINRRGKGMYLCQILS